MQKGPIPVARFYGTRKGAKSGKRKADIKPLLRQIGRIAADQVVKRARSYTSTKTKTKRKRKSGSGDQSLAYYRGRFTNRRFGIKRASAAAKSDNYYARYGVTDTLEVSGVVSDPNCVYVGHSSFSALRLFEACLQAMYRKLFTAAIGYDLSSITEVVPYKNGQSDGCTIHLWWRDASGVMNTVYQGVPPGYTLQNFGSSGFSITGQFTNSVLNNYQLVRIAVYDNDTNLMRASLDLTKLDFDIKYKSELKIQNQSVSVAADNEADDVNNVPIVGRNYEFKNWHPKVNPGRTWINPNTVNPNPFMNINSLSGVSTIRAGELGMEGWREPPASAVFSNVTKSQKVRLQPGHIKSDWLIGGLTVKLDRILQLVDAESATQNSLYRNMIIGKHSMYAMEKLIGSTSAGTQPVRVVYECNHFLGVVAKPGFSHGALGTFYSMNQDNLSP